MSAHSFLEKLDKKMEMILSAIMHVSTSFTYGMEIKCNIKGFISSFLDSISFEMSYVDVDTLCLIQNDAMPSLSSLIATEKKF